MRPIRPESPKKPWKEAYTGTLKGKRLFIVNQMGVMAVCGDMESSDVRLDNETS
jgi:hypothetical protein